MRVLHVITSLKRRGGGPSRSSQGLVAGLNALGIETWLLTINPSEEPWVVGVDYFVNAKPFERIVLDIKPDIVHLHGLWNFDIHRCAVICRRWNIPYVIAPRGMLEPWSLKQKWLKKRIARFLYQDRDLKKAAALHATAESEAEQFRKLGFTNYCIVSPNGVNLPDGKVERVGGDGQRRALFVSRMHQKKGVLELVEAWSRVKPGGWCCELVYTVNSDEERAYEQKVKDRILVLGMSYQDKEGNIHSPTPTQNSNFIFTGSLDDEKKWEAYARADLFILPTYSENFGIVIAEALWAGVPVITTKGTPWGELVGVPSSSGRKESDDHSPTQDSNLRCGWWIDLPEGDGLAKWDALDEALKEATDLDSPTPTQDSNSLKKMGANGHALIERKYTWKAVVGAMKHGYEQILNPCEHAPCDACRNYGDTCPIK